MKYKYISAGSIFFELECFQYEQIEKTSKNGDVLFDFQFYWVKNLWVETMLKNIGSLPLES
jgi:hypothetical protein